MPAQTGKSGLAAKLGKKLLDAHEQHKADETQYGNQGLPEGIEGGVAEVVLCKFDKFKEGQNKDQYYWMAQAVVKRPVMHNGIKVQGQRTQLGPIPVCDTKAQDGKVTTLAEHWAKILNELRKLGLPTKDLSGDKVEAAVAALEKAGIHTRFRTWKGKKQTTGPYAGREPKVVHEWGGAVEFNENTQEMVDDGTGEAVAQDENFTPEDDAAEESQVEETTTEETGEAAPDLDALAEAADAGDQEAGAAIQAMCENAGFTAAEIEKFPSWKAGLAAVRKRESAGEESAEEPKPEEEWKPVKTEIELYKPPKGKKPIECEVLEVYHKAKKVDLKNLDDGKTVYKGVAWSALERGQ